MKPSGYVVWQDPWRVLIITGFASVRNPKTGRMLQTWILAKHLDPRVAVETGRDRLVCGSCPHRGTTCYVNPGRGPLAIWRKWRRGGYPALPSFDLVKGWPVRFGAYGDPAFVPIHVWQQLACYASGWTGYTHRWQWVSPSWAGNGFKALFMASVDSHAEQLEATAQGWRTFRTQRPGQMLFADEIVCPASKEAGHKTTCARCQLCQGASKQAKCIVINLHGWKLGRPPSVK